MIVRMKEILLFTSARSADDTVLQLGELGVVDIKEINGLNSETMERREMLLNRAKNAIKVLKEYTPKKEGVKRRLKYSAKDPKQLIDRVLQTKKIRIRCREILDELREQQRWYHDWGEQINVKEIDLLRENGLYLRLYELDKEVVDSVREKHFTLSFPERHGKVPLVLIGRSELEKLSIKELSLPKLSYKDILKQIESKERQLQKVEHYLEDQTAQISWLGAYQNQLADDLEVEQTVEGMGDIDGRLKYLKGYIPKMNVEALVTAATTNNWGYHISDPENPECVPVYIKNPKWISIINPIMKFIDIVPGYKEVDVSIYFLIAFALFFAMLVGDAGYGLIFLLMTFLLRKKLTAQVSVLIYVLSGATILWGVLSGTYFGSEKIAALPVLNQLIVPEIASFGVDNVSFMMHLSFLIGAIHITIAHTIRLIQVINSLRAISEIGWIALIWVLFLVSEQLVLGKPMPSWGMWLFIVGMVFVALFSKESKNFFMSAAVSLANLPLSLISGFSDIVSYVRLFAVGMATAAVAASFNNMILPEDTEGIGILKLVAMAIALLLGHVLNAILALMAVMVHGIRLNMLEFSGHLGVQFSGEAYKPFQLNSTRNKYKYK